MKKIAATKLTFLVLSYFVIAVTPNKTPQLAIAIIGIGTASGFAVSVMFHLSNKRRPAAKNRRKISVQEWRADLCKCRHPPVPNNRDSLADWARLALADLDPNCQSISHFFGNAALFSLGDIIAGIAMLKLYHDEHRNNVPRKDWLCCVEMLTDLLPLPDGPSPSRDEDYQPILSWLEANQERLVWKETAGMYLGDSYSLEMPKEGTNS